MKQIFSYARWKILETFLEIFKNKIYFRYSNVINEKTNCIAPVSYSLLLSLSSSLFILATTNSALVVFLYVNFIYIYIYKYIRPVQNQFF